MPPNYYMYSIKLQQKGKQKCRKCHSQLICAIYYNKKNKIISKVPHYVCARCGLLDYQTHVLRLSLQCWWDEACGVQRLGEHGHSLQSWHCSHSVDWVHWVVVMGVMVSPHQNVNLSEASWSISNKQEFCICTTIYMFNIIQIPVI